MKAVRPDVERADLRFVSDEGTCAATLYRPDTPAGMKVPCVVMANGVSLTRRDGLLCFAERFAMAGLAALAFDFRHLGDSDGEPRQLIDLRRQRADFRAAVAFARSLEGIDPSRIAAWGFSLAGGVVVHTAADDQKLAAAVALCPMVDGWAFVRTANPLVGVRLVARGLRDAVGRNGSVSVAGPPGSVAILNQPEALGGFESVHGQGSLWRNEVCARSCLRVAPFRPVRVARRVHCPLLVCLGEHDTMVPSRPIVRTAQRAPRGRLLTYPINHFGAFTGEVFERVAGDQVGFLVDHLAPNAN